MTPLDERPATYWPEGRNLPSGAPTEAERAESAVLGTTLHPSFLGGAYLPEALPGEVEIAHIEFRSTTADVISMRARPIGNGIAYRLVDEYENEWQIPQDRSQQPLTLGEMVELLDSAHLADEPELRGLTIGLRQLNLMDPSKASELVDFVRVTSRFYPELEQIDRDRAKTWAAEVAGSAPQD